MAEVGRYAWNGGNQGYAAPASDTAWGTAKVGSYLPNQWGLYDMHGNVIEWCLDWFVDGYPEESVTDPEGAERGTYASAEVAPGRRMRTMPLSSTLLFWADK